MNNTDPIIKQEVNHVFSKGKQFLPFTRHFAVLLIWWSPVEGLSLIEERNILSYFNSENCLIGKIQSCQKVEFIGIHRRVQMVDLIHIYNRKYSWERYDGCNFSWRSELYEYYLRHCSMVPLYFIYWSVYYYIFHKNVGDTR